MAAAVGEGGALRWRYLGGREHGCEHTKEFKSKPKALDNTAKAFAFLHAKRRAPLRCMETEGVDAWQGRLHVCLQCVFVGRKECLQRHTDRTGHYLFLDASSKHAFCAKCGDYVYDGEFERISRRARSKCVAERAGTTPINSPWLPTQAKDVTALQRHMQQQPIVSSSFTPGLGLRGLCNLGNTCFTSCVIQALVHNPLLRNFFLTGRHKRTSRCRTRGVREEAPRSSYKEGDRVLARWGGGQKWFQGVVRGMNERGTYEVLYDDGDTEHEVNLQLIRLAPQKPPEGAAAGVDKGDRCLGCALATIFFEMYSGETKQLTPHRLLYAVWHNSRHLAGYSQQDAHEFFLALLDGLHVHLGGSASSAPGGPSSSTIIQQIFTGALQSDVTCSACAAVSTTIDPFWDISLDVRPIAHMPTPQKGPGAAFDFHPADAEAARGGAAAAAASLHPGAAVGPGAEPTHTLEDCLNRYVRTEQLSSSIFCDRCGSRQQATKRMSMSELPMVVCFHLKRFEHEQQASKIDAVVRFPETLDMRPYLAGSMRSGGAAGEAEGEGGGGAAAAADDSSGDAYVYSLFAVINHHGTMQQGHYTAYVRLAQPGEQWFRCDDETIQMATTSEVLSSEGYMLFYIKRRLEYDS